MWHHPKYYKELRKLRNKLDQAISSESGTPPNERATGPGPKRQASEDSTANSTRGRVAEPEASSNKLKEPQATSDKLTNLEPFIKFQATSIRGLD